MRWELQTGLVTATDSARPSRLWAKDRRATTAGILLLITFEAFEALSVSTALPTIVRELRGEAWYSWPFTAFLAASAVGTVLSGRLCDRRGPVAALIAGPLLFLLGLLVAGTAFDMPMLLLGRVLQGFAAGVQIVALFVVIALVYPERDRPAVFGALSAAWVVPALVGPMIAGLLTQYLSWRWVFLGLIPLVLFAAALLVPVIRQLRDRSPVEAAAPRGGLVLAAFCGAAGLTGLTWAGQHPSPLSVAAGALALVLLGWSVRTLLPRGTLTARPGIPLMVACRGLLSAVFFGAEAFLPLTLTEVHGFTPAFAGLPLTVAAAGWFTGAHWQGRRPEISRISLVRTGFLLIAAALGGLSLVALHPVSGWLALPLWVLAGLGMGLALTSASVRVLELSPPGERGFNSAAAQLADQFAQVLSIGLGGMLVNLIASTEQPGAALLPFDLLLAVLAVLGASLLRPSRNE